MRMRFICCVLGSALLAGPAVAQTPTQPDAIQAELEKLREQAQALLAQVKALQAAKAKVDRERAEKYMREFAESCLDAVLKGDPYAIIPVLSKEIRDLYADTKSPVALQSYALNLDVRRHGIEISGYKITSVAVAPSLEEAIFRGEISGKVKGGDENGKEKAAAFALRVHKGKESGRYVIGFASVYLK